MFGGRVFSASHRGAVRAENQDSLLCRPDIDTYAVADGAGGHENGREAAECAIAAISGISPLLPAAERLPEIRRRIHAAHESLVAHGKAASTLVVLMFEGDYFVCLWVGDSRIYLLRQGELIQLSHDHSLVQEMVDAGRLTEAEARVHPSANVITRAIGGSAGSLQIAKRTGEAEPGDRFLLCSDGLTKTMDDAEIGQLLGGDGDIAARMLDTALRRRARDNVSVVVVCRD